MFLEKLWPPPTKWRPVPATFPFDVNMMDRYKIESVLADALYGQVLVCTDKMTHEQVAIKRMNQACAASKVSRGGRRVAEDISFEKQVNRALSANGGHANIVSMRQDFVEDGHEHFVLDLCVNGDLYKLVNRSIKLDETTASRYFSQIVQGVAFMHHRGFAHRDLSLENILLDADDICHVCDFGLAAPISIRQTAAVGKAFYMAPEVAQGKVYDPAKADVWSLGIILFIMLTGVPLFEMAKSSDQRFEFLETHGLSKLVASWGITLNPQAMKLLKGMLTIDPAKRMSLNHVLDHDFVGGQVMKATKTTRSWRKTLSKFLGCRRSFRKVVALA
ncbi:unnamed protein product [Aphanomyces euteiches]